MNAPKFWQYKNLTSVLLLPFSSLYLMGLAFHQNLRRANSTKVDVPVISVGNLTVGGTGKTPVVSALAEALAKEGMQVGILLRGYGGANNMPHQVTDADDATQVGDEAKMLTHQLKDLPIQIWVAPHRAQAAKRAQRAGCQVLIMDDGFQHRQLARDIDIVVIDGKTGFGNGFVLPAGPLREPAHAIKRANLVLIFGKRKFAFAVPTLNIETTAYAEDIAALKNKNVFAFCGIGRPEKFYETLSKNAIKVLEKRSFSDHHKFNKGDLYELKQRAAELKATLVTTEKDAERLPKEFRKHCRVVRIRLSEKSIAKIMAVIKGCSLFDSKCT